MEDDEDWVMRPVLEGLCHYESLITPGVLSLVDIMRMNEALNVRDENRYRFNNVMRE